MPMPPHAAPSHAAPSTALSPRLTALLLLFTLVLLLPGRMRLPPMDRDESRYLQATSQMLETHNLVDVRFQDKPRYLQPAGIYWLEAAAVASLRMQGVRTPWPYRIPSLIGAMAAVLLTARMGASLFGAPAGMAAGLLLACSVLLNVEGRIATIDATLLAVILVAQTALLRLYQLPDSARRPGAAALYWGALGCGLMLKGPVILLVSGGTLLGLTLAERRIGWMRRLQAAWGVPLMLLIVLPWCVAIGVISHGDFFSRAVGHNLLGKVASGQEAHGLPPGYHLAAFLLAFFPGSLLAALALPGTWARRHDPRIRFLIAWIVPNWGLFELIATKLPHYVLPTYPAIALLAAAAIVLPGGWRGGRGARVLGWIYGAAWTVLGVGLALAGPVVLWRLEGRIAILPIAAAAVATSLVIAGAVYAIQRRPHGLLCASVAAGTIIVCSTFGVVLPGLHSVWLSPQIARVVALRRPCADSVLASSSYSEPSLVFLVGEHTKLIGAAAAADFLQQNPACNMALIGRHDLSSFLGRFHGAAPRKLAEISGINVSNGRRLELSLFSGPPPLQ